VQWTNCSSASANGDNDHLLSEAADFMLQAIRCASRMTAWEYWAELGWIYQRQSKLAASLKAYCLAMDMLEECKVQREGSGDDLVLAEATIRTDLALVYRGMGLVDDAMKHLTAALELGTDRMDDAQHAMILLGSAQARLAQCHARSCEGLYSAAAAALMAGINIADQLVTVLQCSLPLQHRLDVTDVVWKLLGDLKLYASRLPPSCFGGFSGVQKLLAEAAQAYSKAREAIDGRGGGVSAQATAEYDIGLAHLQHAWSLQLEMGDGSGLWLSEQYVQLPEILRLRSLASRHFKASINLEPTSSAAWVGLGCSSPHPLAQQHCFVRSTQIDRNHSGLVNLASMYCRYSKNDEAYETLNVLQSAVDHPLMWVMLGLLKEAEGTSGTCKQACDAFYSSLEAAHPLDGLMGLGRTTPLVHSLQDGIVALELYCDINPANALAWTVLGLLFEASERPAKASRCYLDAWKLLERQEGVMGTTAETVQARSIIMENLCRASSVAKSCLPSFELPDLFDSVKLATHSQALLSASKGAWKDALVCIADQEHLVGSVLHVLVSFWGGDTSGAMQLGAQRMTTQASMCVFDGGKGLDGLPIYGGIRNIRQEHKSTAVATRELQAQASALAACRTSTSTQRRLLCRALHLRPESPSLWAQLASACLREEWGSAVAAGLAKSCASAATNLVRCYHADTSQRGWAMFRGIDGAIGMEGDEGVIAPAPTAEVEALSFSTQALSGMVNAASSRKTIRLLLKALHTDPSNLASWHLLASALVGHVIEEDRGDNESLALATASSIFVMLSLPAPSAHCILLQGNLHEAREAASYITSGPQKALHEARSFASERNWDAAVARYKEAGLQDPSQWHHEIVQELSNCLEMQGEVVVAAAFLRTAAALQAGHAEKNQSSSAAAAAASLLLKLSSLLHRHGRLNDAMSTLNEASALLRRNSEAQATISFLRGAIWAAGSNSKKKAMDALDRAKDSSVPPELLAAYSATLQ
jgi:tetratricopeptide (TPR) repeat protein